MDERKSCPELKEYSDWMRESVLPRLKGFAAHVATCSACLSLMSGLKDRMALVALTTSDADFQRIVEGLGSEEEEAGKQ